MPAIEYELVTEEPAFIELADQWNRLADQTDPHSVFLRHEWFDSAWRWLRDSSSLCVVWVKRDGELIGICPLILERSLVSRLPATIVKFLAIPDTQESALLAHPANLADVATGLVSCLFSKEVDWDVIQLEKLRAESAGVLAVSDAIREIGCPVQTEEGAVSPGIGLEGSWSDYYSRRSRRLKKGNNLIVNRLKRSEKKYEIHCYDRAVGDDIDLPSLMNTLVSLSATSWKSR